MGLLNGFRAFTEANFLQRTDQASTNVDFNVLIFLVAFNIHLLA